MTEKPASSNPNMTLRKLQGLWRRWISWEFWPPWLFYIPIGFRILWLALRYRGFSLPFLTNPGRINGSMVGQSKIAILRALHDACPEFVAEAWLLEGTTPEARLKSLNAIRQAHQVEFPFILKPDLSNRGTGVKKIASEDEAAAYLGSMHAPVLAQRYAPGPHEAGVFYYRYPHQEEGQLFAVTEKIFPTLTGDGQSTLEELIWRDERAFIIAPMYLKRFRSQLEHVVPKGEIWKLVDTGNHAQGCIFLDGQRMATEALRRRTEQISRSLDGFYLGRFDIRYESEEDLREGNSFKIVELNGAASEATSVYDPAHTIREVYGTLFKQWRIVYEIGAENRARGAEPVSLFSLWKRWRRLRKQKATHPTSD